MGGYIYYRGCQQRIVTWQTLNQRINAAACCIQARTQTVALLSHRGKLLFKTRMSTLDLFVLEHEALYLIGKFFHLRHDVWLWWTTRETVATISNCKSCLQCKALVLVPNIDFRHS